MIGDWNLTIDPSDYAIDYDNDGQICAAGIRASTDGTFKFGVPLLRAFYTIIDDENKQVGFSMRQGSLSVISTSEVLPNDDGGHIPEPKG